jgi:hypothetical protein
MFMVDDHYQIQANTAQFFGAQILTQEWAQPKDAEHRLYAASSDLKDSAGHILVTAYPLQRPDGQWSVMLINKDHDNAHEVRIVFHDADNNRDTFFTGSVAMITFGKAQYQWHAARKKGYADPDGPPATSQIKGGENALYRLPAASLSVLRGKLQPKENGSPAK